MRRFSIVPSLTLAGTLLTISGCGAAPDPGRGLVEVRDSAGFRIVESSAPSWPAGSGWKVAAAPRLVVGDLEGDPAYELFRVTGLVSLSDGRIMLANGGTAQLRLYTGDGEHIRDIGRRGAGPGEYEWIHGIWRAAGDSTVVFDAGPQRVSILDPQGDFVRSFNLQMITDYGIPSIVDYFSDGTLVSMSGTDKPIPPGIPIVSSGTSSGGAGDSDVGVWLFSRYSATGSFQNILGGVREGPRWYGRTGTDRFLPFTLGPPIFAAGGELLHFGSGQDPEIEVRNSDGEPVRILRWGSEPRVVARDDVARLRTHTLDRIRNEDRRRVEAQWLDEVTYPKWMPTYQGLLVDALGYLWVERYRAPWESEPRWWIFDPDGVWLGEVETPAGFIVQEIGPDYILATGRGEHDIELVALFPLTRSG